MKASLIYTYKTGGIVIPNGLGISIRLQNRVGIDNTVLQVGFLFLRRIAILFLSLSGSEDSKVGDDLFGILCLAGPGLPSDQHGLVLGLGHHTLVSALGDGEQVGRDLVPPLADVQLDHTVGVDGVTLVGVDDNAEQTRVSLIRTKNII